MASTPLGFFWGRYKL